MKRKNVEESIKPQIEDPVILLKEAFGDFEGENRSRSDSMDNEEIIVVDSENSSDFPNKNVKVIKRDDVNDISTPDVSTMASNVGSHDNVFQFCDSGVGMKLDSSSVITDEACATIPEINISVDVCNEGCDIWSCDKVSSERHNLKNGTQENTSPVVNKDEYGNTEQLEKISPKSRDAIQIQKRIVASNVDEKPCHSGYKSSGTIYKKIKDGVVIGGSLDNNGFEHCNRNVGPSTIQTGSKVEVIDLISDDDDGDDDDDDKRDLSDSDRTLSLNESSDCSQVY